ncbi:VOC family protein [Chitinispirillales bacterium ANBcel5]|uniref:VOC family protein n=1 Tax=Cellulosispirillum alkaliphilum TaxID=3039283 RepID=UPI002A5249BB|nr:VOC family protein [Chitinispirillales bacterium ANBcel5]
MATKSDTPVPEGANTLTLYLSFKRQCSEAIELYRNAFDARSLMPPMTTGDGRIIHSMIRIGDSNIMMSDLFDESNYSVGNMTSVWMYVSDCDAVFNKAVSEGFEVIMPLEDQFWGDRMGMVKDPFGYMWSIATNKWKMSEDEIKQREKEWFKSMGLE